MSAVIALIPGQTQSFVPLWLTPLWILALGLLVGLVGTLAIYVVLGGLSKIPALGTIADDKRKATIVALSIAAAVALLGVLRYVVFAPTSYLATGAENSNQHGGFLVLPWVCVGLLIGWGFVYGVWHRTIKELVQILSEGVLGYVLITLISLTVLGLAATPVVSNRAEILSSIPVAMKSELYERQFTLEPAPQDLASDLAPFQRIDGLVYDSEAMSEVVVASNRTIMIADAETPAEFSMAPQRVESDSPASWRRMKDKWSEVAMPLPLDPSRGVYIQNREIDEATVTVSIVTKPPAPEARTIWVAALAVFMLISGMITIRQAAPQVSAIALATAKSEMAQPLYLTLLMLAGVAIVISVWVPFSTLGEDIKVLKDSGMTLIMIVSIIHAVWASGTSVSEEIEGRTALTVLSKPVSRRSFLLGKYMGIMGTVLLMFLLLGMLLLIVTAYKPIYDAREGSAQKPDWQLCHLEMVTTTPGLCLLFMETTLIAGISVAIATRLPIIANFIVCFTIYVIGNITAPIVRASAEDNELVRFVGRLIAVVVPNLNTFNVQAAVDAGNPIPPIYLAGALTYLICFGVMISVVALLLFEDRDLA